MEPGTNEVDGLSRPIGRSTNSQEGIANKEDTYSRRQSSFSSGRRASLPSMSYNGSPSYSTLPRSSRRTSGTEKRTVIEEATESMYSHASDQSSNMSLQSLQHTQSPARSESPTKLDPQRVLSDPNITRQRNALDLGKLSRTSSDVISQNDTTPMANGRCIATPSPQHGRSVSPAPPQRSSSHDVMSAHRLSLNAAGPAPGQGSALPSGYPGRETSLSPEDGAHRNLRRRTVAGTVQAFEEAGQMESHSSSTSPEGLVYSSSYSSASSAYMPSTSSGLRGSAARGPSNPQRSLSPASTGSSSSSHSGAANWSNASSAEESGEMRQVASRHSSSQAPSMPPQYTVQGKGLGRYTELSSSPANEEPVPFRRTPPLRRKAVPANQGSIDMPRRTVDRDDLSPMTSTGNLHPSPQAAGGTAFDHSEGVSGSHASGMQPPSYSQYMHERPQSAGSRGGVVDPRMAAQVSGNRPSSGQLRRSATEGGMRVDQQRPPSYQGHAAKSSHSSAQLRRRPNSDSPDGAVTLPLQNSAGDIIGCIAKTF